MVSTNFAMFFLSMETFCSNSEVGRLWNIALMRQSVNSDVVLKSADQYT